MSKTVIITIIITLLFLMNIHKGFGLRCFYCATNVNFPSNFDHDVPPCSEPEKKNCSTQSYNCYKIVYSDTVQKGCLLSTSKAIGRRCTEAKAVAEGNCIICSTDLCNSSNNNYSWKFIFILLLLIYVIVY